MVDGRGLCCRALALCSKELLVPRAQPASKAALRLPGGKMEVKKKLLPSPGLGNGAKPPEKDVCTGRALAVLCPSWPLKDLLWTKMRGKETVAPVAQALLCA